MVFGRECGNHLASFFGASGVGLWPGALIVGVCSVLILAGCGSSSDPATPSAESAESPAPSQESPSASASETSSGDSSPGSGSSGPRAPLGSENPPPAQDQSFPSISFPQLGSSAAGPQISANPVVQVDTNFGSFQMELDRQRAPITTENFLNYVERGQYDQTLIHQVFPKAVIVGGGYTLRGEPIKVGPPIFNEAHNGLKNIRGTVAMYRDPADPHSATSVFFINVKDNPAYDHRSGASAGGQPAKLGSIPPEDYGYCVFGRVIQGMEVVDKIASVPVHDTEQFERTPIQPVIVHTIRWVK